MFTLLRHIVFSVLIGVLAAGGFSAILMATIPAGWRGPGMVAAIAVVSVAGVVFARGIRPPEP